MKIIDLNRDGGIGANSLYCQLGNFHFVIDSGLNPKSVGSKAAPDLTPLEGVELDLIIITHCHLDHIGSLPLLMRAHPNTPVVLSVPSRMLIDRMLHNSANVMVRERAEKNVMDYPLFTHEEIDRVMARVHAHPFGIPKKFTGKHDEIEFTLHPAGHVAGAAGVEIVHKHRRIFFTGDVLFETQRILGPAKFPKGHFDTLVMETTRGATERPVGQDRTSEVMRLIDQINTTIAHGGSVLIPVFALGRMQEIFALFHDARKFGKLVQAPIFATGLGLDLCNYFDDIAKKTNLVHFTRTILKDLHVRKSPRDLVPGKQPHEQGIYVVSSGMMVEKTPSYTLASCLLGGANNAICFVGYCDPDTPGGKLQAVRKGDEFLFAAVNVKSKVRCRIERFELSGHADRDELMDYAVQCEPRSIVLTHGDQPARDWFMAQLVERLPHAKLLDPQPLQVYQV
ncbi:MAG: MBL fold metallo-hydrolase [Candidatus Didemnitutus sp.]|nr:MBL fold metallo-hydrolase [Candidatus Didemnitutus sp.]